jgi:integrase
MPAMADNLSNGIIVETDASCVIDKIPCPGLPTLVWPEGIDEAASDWFRYLIRKTDALPSSAKEYAKILRPFLRYCRSMNVDWRSVDDRLLMLWRDQMLAKGAKASRVKSSIRTIFQFYCWAESARYIRYRVAIYSEEELPGHMVGFPFPISAKLASAKTRSGSTSEHWVSTISVRGHRQKSRPRHTPTEHETRMLHQVAATNRNSERESLIFSWAEETGARRAEILRLRISHLPDLVELEQLIERDEPCVIEVLRKGGEVQELVAPPDLIIRTLDYVEYERQAIVRQSRDAVGYAEPDEVFLSSATGLVLHPDSVTTMGSRAFQRAGIKRASLHRLRAKFAVSVVESLVEAVFSGHSVGSTTNWVETILVKAADMMGHATPDSLRPYLTFVLNRRIQLSDSERARRLEARLRQLRLSEQAHLRRLGTIGELQEIAQFIQSGREGEAAEALRKVANQLIKPGERARRKESDTTHVRSGA